jgi:hypothetical protein
MPLSEGILGFSNRWYADALHTATQVALPNGLAVRSITAPYFLGTKMEAFRRRGKGDYFASHDLEDIITIVDGRPSLFAEVQASKADLRSYLGEAFAMLLAQSRFLDALPGFLPPDAANQARISRLSRNLSALSMVR